MRIAVIDRKLCTKEKCNYICEKVCPVNRMRKKCIEIEEETKFPKINEELCLGCGICVKKCPLQCIKVINLKEEIGNPMHQYGVNSFRLYNLPLPKDGVAGLIGKNGLGKSTAIKILTKQLIPNFGNFDVKFEKIETKNLTVEQKNYFNSLENNLKISYKIQNIEKVREYFNGSVEEFISHFIKDKVQEILENFNLKKIKTRNVQQLSGGELQKLLFAIAYSKEADFYFFDETTNYLDIAERLKVALLIKELGEKKKVMIIEHDLAILDYSCDYIYIFFGEENAYGVVSKIKHVRAGINEYLEGFLRDENIKFREYEIKFSSFSESEKKTNSKISYTSLVKKYNEFKVECEGGEIREGEIIGIVGKNALGKSTFVKMLSGNEKPDEGKVDTKNFTISYKQQYLKSDEDLTVEEYLKREQLNSFILEECKRKLEIDKLMFEKLSNLSGGELQRVEIAKCISKEADIFLLDEPTAFLDIEQRIKVADLLRNIFNDTKKCAFIVDHDILFIDAISSRIVVFEGEESIYGKATKPLNKKEGMNRFLKSINITMRRDKETNRPRINKPESVLDRTQKEEGNYFY